MRDPLLPAPAVRRLVSVLFAGMMALLGAPAAAAQPDTEELIAAVDKAFSAKAAPRKPPLLIFPVVGSDERVIHEGVTLGYMATFAAIYTKRKHIDICAPLTLEVFREASCAKEGAALDADTIRLCCAAFGTKLHALPKLEPRDGGEVLTIACHGDGDAHKDKTFTHSLKPRERARVPGLIAQSVQQYLGVDLTPDEKAQVAAPQVRTEEDLLALADAVEHRRPVGQGGADLPGVLERNPRCVVGWELAITSVELREAALLRFRQLQPPLECPRLLLAESVQVRGKGEPERALRLMLPLAASERGDNYFQTSLMKCGMVLKDAKLTRHLLELWRKEEPGYAGCLRRGQLLIEWAWDARGSGWANTVTPEGARLFLQRLQEAQRELEQAVRINPSGWVAHSRLLTVARGLGLPRDFMEDHFRRAVKLRPRYLPVYEAKMQCLQPRWGGTPEELIEFGRECAATGYWEESIPRVLPFALRDCSTNPADSGRIWTLFKVPEVWEAGLEYYRSAARGGGPDDRRRVLNQLVQWGMYGEHEEDIVIACQKLRGVGMIDPEIFPDLDELEFLYDRVHARTGKLMTKLHWPLKNDRALAQTAAALAEGEEEAAARFLEKVETDNPLDREKAAAYRAAIALGRKLKQDKRLDLKGAEGLEAFLGARPSWRYSGDKFVCQLLGQQRTALTFPLGLRHAVIHGSLEWTEGISYVQIVAHTHALRDQVSLRYLAQNNPTVELIRNRSRLNSAGYPRGRLDFQLAYGDRRDILQPAKGVVWQAGVYDDVPSGFSIQVYTLDRPATLILSDLHIEQRE